VEQRIAVASFDFKGGRMDISLPRCVRQRSGEGKKRTESLRELSKIDA